ncbi:MAG: DUF1833 family protein [Parvibaculum sp.]|uniref:DUF1833 family protein n=1 Tax=Parvibaculum sp. TaxID=2024848 RepID=UPI002AB83BB0|nr:DUF1833 family protein [Parvibaculum sp.]MDZ4382798.1 DUF1833 family protein [Parvibaculum sp.]
MPRALSAPFRYSLERQETGEALIVFLTITHPALSEAIRVVSDGVDYVWNGLTYTGFPFEISLISDGDRPPSAQLSVQNVDRRIGEAVRDLASPPRLRIDVLAASDFDESATPRVSATTGEPEAEYTAASLFLANVRGDAFLEAEITGWNYLQEVWPGIRATQNRLPGLYR